MAKTALIIGGTGQIGWAAAERLRDEGWEVTVGSRSEGAVPDGVQGIPLDRQDTDHLVLEASGRDLVLDAVAFSPEHGAQLTRLAGSVGSLVVISTASVYLGANGTYLDIVTGDHDFPVFPDAVDELDPVIDNDERTYSPLKAAMERVLLDAPDLPVSILRPQAIHGPHGAFLREWFFVKRALDHRPHAVLAYDATSRFGSTATATIAELVRLCAEQPGRRVLNAADEPAFSVREIGESVFHHLGHEARIIGLPGEARGDLGTSPWGVPRPFVLSMERAKRELGYQPLGTYPELVAPAIDWIVDAAAQATARGQTWREAFPRMVERYGADTWFDYDAEDAFVAAQDS